MKLKMILIMLLALVLTGANAQDNAPANWFNLDPSRDGIPGLGTESLYKRLAGKKGETVIVAVIDSGVDYEHEDLKDVMWVNPGEIPGNGIDDDKNGYVDDIHGWNFIGNANGENIYHDNLEVTRLYVQYGKKYANADRDKLSKKEKKEYDQYLDMKETIESKRASLSQQFPLYQTLKGAMEQLIEQLGKSTNVTADDLKQVKSDDQMVQRLTQIMIGQMEQGISFQDFVKDIDEAYEYFDGQLNYNYNPDFDPRALVGDNYNDLSERYYGNNDVRGPDANHGTHVAGIIGAVRNNNIGIDGVANNVRIMSVRTVPDGDERDKDVANAIIYAVDNGAKVINMSFGKGYSPHKDVVDKAIKYALKNDVLLVHAAGNDGSENTATNNYPNDQFAKKGLFGPKYAKNWIEVGALNWRGGDDLAASFSNYSKDRVDVFAPGVDVYSTVVGNQYDSYPGTSMASPMVAGTAAILRSYFPDLSADQVKEVIMDSAVKYTGKVTLPGGEEMVPFSDLSVTGGSLNAEKAVEVAMKTVGKKKGKTRFLNGDLPKKDQVIP
ncbi:MAG: S8 family serine peptidase [Lewinellaceae bacterium]|nr:S8 family serine peptidase [Lewinellaceae bacterium]